MASQAGGAAATKGGSSSRDRILAAALGEFAARGFAAARLGDIARAADLSHPTLLYHFSSKESLYAAVIEEAAADWAAETRAAISTGLRGFEQVASLIEAAYRFFGRHEDFVRVMRREAIEGGGRLEELMAESLRPFLDDAVEFLEREAAAGRLRPHDPLELMQVCYGAVFTYFSDARFRARLLGEDPLTPDALDRQVAALVELLRAALDPATVARPGQR